MAVHDNVVPFSHAAAAEIGAIEERRAVRTELGYPGVGRAPAESALNGILRSRVGGRIGAARDVPVAEAIHGNRSGVAVASAEVGGVDELGAVGAQLLAIS